MSNEYKRSWLPDSTRQKWALNNERNRFKFSIGLILASSALLHTVEGMQTASPQTAPAVESAAAVDYPRTGVCENMLLLSYPGQDAALVKTTVYLGQYAADSTGMTVSFGDGTYDQEPLNNPSSSNVISEHHYIMPGTYSITATVALNDGTDIATCPVDASYVSN